jgi:hypothetical protein
MEGEYEGSVVDGVDEGAVDGIDVGVIVLTSAEGAALGVKLGV